MLLAFAALAAATQTPALEALRKLAGCWTAPGTVLGKPASSIARGSWRLGGRYFMLQLKSVSPQDPYETALVYGSGDKPNEINAYWMDTFGGAYSTPGAGEVTSDGFKVVYTYPDSVYTNRFERRGSGWRWTIMEKRKDKSGERIFAEYMLAPGRCGKTRFDF